MRNAFNNVCIKQTSPPSLKLRRTPFFVNLFSSNFFYYQACHSKLTSIASERRMVEVTGIEPVSRNKSKAKPTCLAVFGLTHMQENSQNTQSSQPENFQTTLQTSAVYSY